MQIVFNYPDPTTRKFRIAGEVIIGRAVEEIITAAEEFPN
jgi:hypothetical protein